MEFTAKRGHVDKNPSKVAKMCQNRPFLDKNWNFPKIDFFRKLLNFDSGRVLGLNSKHK